MNITETRLKGAFIIELEPHFDERGFFSRMFCRREFEKIRTGIEFVQSNISHNQLKGTTRGMHFQRPPHAEDKLVSCIRGSAIDVIVDVRRNSPTFLQHITIELTASNNKMVFIPVGFAHGFQTLEDDTRLTYHHTEFYQPNSEVGLRYDDPKLGIDWPNSDIVISEKDRGYSYLTDSFSGISLT